MNPINSGSINPGGQYPPSDLPQQNTGVWPPPPSAPGSGPQSLTFPFETIFQYVKSSSVPLLRFGMLTLYPQGVSIQGKAVTRYEIQAPIIFLATVLRLFLVAYIILEYAFRRDEFLNVPWSDVKEVVLVPKKSRFCLVYSAPNYKGVIKTFSLTSKLDPMQYQAFAANVAALAPGQIREGKLRSWTSIPVWMFCLGFVVLITAYSLYFGSFMSGLEHLNPNYNPANPTFNPSVGH